MNLRAAFVLLIEKLRDFLEDIADLAVVAKRRKETSISHEELIAELKKDGLL